MMHVPDAFRILPEIVLTLTGVLVMLIDASLSAKAGRRWLGYVVAFGSVAGIYTSIWQLSLPMGTAYSGTVESSPFTVFFHVLICGIVLVTTLLAMDSLPAESHHQGE